MTKESSNSRFNHWPMTGGQERPTQFADGIAGARGFTLVELMIALTISLIILAVMTQIFASSRATYKVAEGLSRIQEGGRFSLDTLAYEIRTAGFFGCSNVPPTMPPILTGPDNAKTTVDPGMLNNTTIYDPTAQAGIQGYRYTGTGGNSLTTDWSPTLSANFLFSPGDIRAYSDVLIVRHATSNGVTITDAPPGTDGPLTIRVEDRLEFAVNDILMINNCKQSDMFIVTGITGAGATRTIEHDTSGARNATATLFHKYSAGAELLKYTTSAYYVGNTGRTDRNGILIPALFRNTWTPAGGRQQEELVEGVEAMQVYYGVLSTAGTKTDAIPDRYVPANKVDPNWLSVASVRVGVVISTAERTSSDSENTAPAGFNVLGVSTDASAPYVDNYVPSNPNDGRARRVFTFVVNKRQPTR